MPLDPYVTTRSVKANRRGRVLNCKLDAFVSSAIAWHPHMIEQVAANKSSLLLKIQMQNPQTLQLFNEDN